MSLIRRRRAFLLLIPLLACGTVAAAWADEGVPPEDAVEKAYQDALERAAGIEKSLLKAVAKVRVNSVAVQNLRNIRGTLRKASGGSGVIVTRKGKLWILTNVHVTKGHNKLTVVTHDGVTRDVEQHDSIPEYDIALLRFTEKPKRVKFKGVNVRASRSMRGLKEGTWVIATGSPFFLGEDGASVTTLGVISGLDRFLGGEFQYVGAIQHDAEVNPGNSGGPLWNLRGDLLGINGKIATSQRIPGARPTNTGAAFSLHIQQVEAYLNRLVGDENAEAGFLGVNAETATDKKGKAIGARVVSLHGKSPMNRGKDRPVKGDIITALIVKGSQKRIYTAQDLLEVVSVLGAGTEVTIKFKRGRSYKRWKGKLGDKAR